MVYESSVTTCDGSSTSWGRAGLQEALSTVGECETWCKDESQCNYFQYQPGRPMCHLYMDCDVTRTTNRNPGDTYEMIREGRGKNLIVRPKGNFFGRGC